MYAVSAMPLSDGITKQILTDNFV